MSERSSSSPCRPWASFCSSVLNVLHVLQHRRASTCNNVQHRDTHRRQGGHSAHHRCHQRDTTLRIIGVINGIPLCAEQVSQGAGKPLCAEQASKGRTVTCIDGAGRTVTFIGGVQGAGMPTTVCREQGCLPRCAGRARIHPTVCRTGDNTPNGVQGDTNPRCAGRH